MLERRLLQGEAFMRTVKNDRQETMINLIRQNEISTQEMLTKMMQESGFQVTQATVSRDIKELGIIKAILPNNQTKYAVLDKTGDIAPGRLLAIFNNALISCQSAMNLVVIRTLPGMAQACASALDSMHFDSIVGSIAGDDTVFIATHSIEEADELVNIINDRLKQEY